MPVTSAGPSFVAWCRGCPWRSVHHLRRDAQQALGRHGETCGKGAVRAVAAPRSGAYRVAGPEGHRDATTAQRGEYASDSDDEREAGR